MYPDKPNNVPLPFISDFKGILFDAEGVVIHTENLWDLGQQRILEKRGLRYNREHVKPQLAGLSLDMSTRRLMELYNIRENFSHFMTERMQTMQSLLENRVEFIEGFLDFFHLIKEVGLKYAIATSIPVDLMHPVDRKLDLFNLFDGHIYFVEDAGKSKPNPDVFLLAADKIGLPPAKCLVIEDSPMGIQAAHNAGMKCIALTTTFSGEVLDKYDPFFICDSFSDIRF